MKNSIFILKGFNLLNLSFFLSFAVPVYPQDAVDTGCRMTILYDNYKYLAGTKPDWGFSCLIEAHGKRILFDTGTRPDILENNCRISGVDISSVDVLVISHNHLDHTGGMWWVLGQAKGIRVYMPCETSEEVLEKIEQAGGTPLVAPGRAEISEDVFITGNLLFPLPEQALNVITPKGMILITGCSHPGIISFLELTKKSTDLPLYLAFGGFHLYNHSSESIKTILEDMDRLGLEHCGATHCTGEKAIETIREHFGERFTELGTGRVLMVE